MDESKGQKVKRSKRKELATTEPRSRGTTSTKGTTKAKRDLPKALAVAEAMAGRQEIFLQEERGDLTADNADKINSEDFWPQEAQEKIR